MAATVLVVDDDASFHPLAARMLAAAGLEVIGDADTAAGAVDEAIALRPTAVLVDVGLPDGSGVALARRLAALPWRPAIVLTSIDPQAANREEVRRSGASAFIPKEQLPSAPLARLLSRD